MIEAGTVYLVGAGPGDPGLLTVRGQELLARADVVVYDALANAALLAQVRPGAETIYVGKRAANHAMTQDEINLLLVEKARTGAAVVRLKGGDPFVFGRGGEEALVLREHGVPFEVVPGVTAGIAAPAYAGIPVTHRTHASTVTLVTGHEDPEKDETAIRWKELAGLEGTLVFYMGVRNLGAIMRNLQAHGMAPDTPVALVHRGTLPAQRSVRGTAADIEARVRAADLKPPALIVVGKVVQLQDELAWFETRPLFGRTIVVTRARTQASDLAAGLAQRGANVLLQPTIRIEPPADWQPLRAAVRDLANYDWLVFASTNSVDMFFAALAMEARDSRALARCRVCSIGPGTTEALRTHGVLPDLEPGRGTSDAMFDALQAAGAIQGRRFLLPRTDIAPDAFPDRLEQAGGQVSQVIAYRTLPGDPVPEVMAQLRAGSVDMITFTSSSTVRNFAALAARELGGFPAGVCCVSIGPQTSATANALGIRIDVEAQRQTIDGLIEVILAHVAKRAGGAG